MDKLLPKLELVLNAKKKITPFIWGPPGIGKSAIVEQLAISMKLDMIDCRAALYDATDWRGFPFVGKKMLKGGKEIPIAQWASPEWLPSSGSGLFFIDEINRADRRSLQALFQLILNRKIGTYTLPEGWIIIAAGNYGDDDDCDTEELDSAFKNRFVHIFTEVKPKFWLKWAKKSSINKYIIDFISAKESMLFQGSDTKGEYAFATPRTYEFLSDIFNGEEEKPKVIEMLNMIGSGTIGEIPTAEFRMFLNTLEIVRAEDVLFNYGLDATTKDKLSKFTNDRILSVNNEIVNYISTNKSLTKVQLDNIINYMIDFVEDEAKVAFVQDIISIKGFDTFEIFGILTEKIPEVIKLVSKAI
jgi:hypothetical protein